RQYQVQGMDACGGHENEACLKELVSAALAYRCSGSDGVAQVRKVRKLELTSVVILHVVGDTGSQPPDGFPGQHVVVETRAGLVPVVWHSVGIADALVRSQRERRDGNCRSLVAVVGNPIGVGGRHPYGMVVVGG